MRSLKFFLTAIFIVFAAALIQAERTTIIKRGGNEGGGSSRPAQPSSGGANRGGGTPENIAKPPVVIKMRRYNVPQPARMRQRETVRDHIHANPPANDEHGAPITQRATTVVPRHTTIVRNQTVINDIRQHRRTEIVPNRFYWHDSGGVRYCHYYDRGVHWYGFYNGPTFYWARYHRNHWWWFDVRFGRWVYWWDGYWWWPSSTGVAYVYMDNNYYPYENGTVVVQRPEMEAPPENAPASSEGRTWNSPDKTRMVQVVGEKSEAFLYDGTGASPVFLKYLATGVTNVRFSTAKNGKPAQILLELSDGSFALTTWDGVPLDAPESVDDIPTTAPPDVTPPETTP